MLSLNLDGADGYQAELKRVMLSLETAYTTHNPDGTYSNPEVVYPFTSNVLKIANVNGKMSWVVDQAHATDANGDVAWQAVSDRFKALFAGFMPGDRQDPGPDGILGTADDTFTPDQLDDLDDRISDEADDLYDVVVDDYDVISDTITIQRDNPGANVQMTWKDLGSGLYGSTSHYDYDYNKMIELIGTQGRTNPITGSTFNKQIPEAAQMWALAQYINNTLNDTGNFAVGINTNLTNASITFAQYVEHGRP